MFICSLYSIILTGDAFSLITYWDFFVYWIIYTLSWHCVHLIPNPDTAIAMRNQNRTCPKNKNNTWTLLLFVAYSRRKCLFLFSEISILLLLSKTHWEKDHFFRISEQHLAEKDAIFLNKMFWKITRKSALDNLNCKTFFVCQPW